jgi:hypothetical protein
VVDAIFDAYEREGFAPSREERVQMFDI